MTIPNVNLPKRKWRRYWLGLAALGVCYLVVAFIWCGYSWMDSWLQVGGTTLALFSAVIIMLQSREDSEAGTQLQIAIQREESERQINALQRTTEKQMQHLSSLTNQSISVLREESQNSIKEMQASTMRQIQVIQENTTKQMDHFTELVNKQIETHKSESQKQVENFIQQTDEITDRLEGVALQLGEIAKLSGQLVETEKQLKAIEERKLRQREEELQQRALELFEIQERSRPIIAFRLERENNLILPDKLFVHVYNGGGDASSVYFTIRYRNSGTGKSKMYSQTFTNLRRGHTMKFQTGLAKNMKDCDTITVEYSVWDLAQREYYANQWLQREEDKWLTIEADERKMLS